MSSIENIKRLESQPLPFVVIDRTYSDSNCSYVKHDDYNGAYIAVRHLIEKGYRRISIITGAKDCVISQSRAEGYINALKEHGIPLQENLIRSSSQANKDEGYRLFKDLWEKEATDAVFAITDMLASGVYEYAHEKGISIPNDLGVVGYSNSDIAEVLYPKLTSVQQNGDEMGKTSLMFLLNQIASDVKIQHKVFESDLVIRASTRKDSTAKQ
jgi:LacI family transcriptional regulator